VSNSKYCCRINTYAPALPWDGQGIAHKQMKKSATQSRKRDSDLDPANHIGSGAEDISGSVGAEDGHDLAQLVWKYFGEEITETLREVQDALTAEQRGSSQKVSSRK
jgi:hypothetical protein